MGWIIAGIVVVVLIISYIIGKKEEAGKTGKTASAGKGSLIAGRETIAYFKDDVVYDRNMVNIGTYKPSDINTGWHYDFIFDDKIVGYYQSTGDDIKIWRQGKNLWDMECVGRIYSNDCIVPEKDNYEVILFTGDSVGAAAAYVILCYEFIKYDNNYMQYFIK